MAAADNNQVKKTNTLAIIGLIAAILIPPVGLVLCIIALTQAKKRNESGKGLAIAGVVISILELLFTVLLIGMLIFAAAQSNIKLVTYNNSEIGYTVPYPQNWTIESSTSGAVKSVTFKDKVEGSELVRGQEEVVYVPASANSYGEAATTKIREAFNKDYKNFQVISSNSFSFKGRQALQLVASYDGQNGKIKGIFTIIVNKDNSIYTVVTQTPEQNWSKYEGKFKEIQNSFSPN